MVLSVEYLAQYLNPAFEAAFPEIAAFCVYEISGTFRVEIYPTNGKGFGVVITTFQTPKELILMQIGIIHEVFLLVSDYS